MLEVIVFADLLQCFKPWFVSFRLLHDIPAKFVHAARSRVVEHESVDVSLHSRRMSVERASFI